MSAGNGKVIGSADMGLSGKAENFLGLRVLHTRSPTRFFPMECLSAIVAIIPRALTQRIYFLAHKPTMPETALQKEGQETPCLGLIGLTANLPRRRLFK